MLVQRHISGIRNSDFFVSDAKMLHRLVGLKWIRGVDICPLVTFVSSPIITDFALAKQMIFKSGKKIYCDNKFSARLAHFYNVGDLLYFEADLKDAATLYTRFFNPLAQNPDF